MRTTHLLPLALFAACLLIATPAHAGEDDWSLDAWKKRTSEWEGYAVGTMVHTKNTNTVTMAQLPKPRTTVSETKRTLMAISEKEFTVKVETRVGEAAWTTMEVKEPRRDPKAATYKEEKLGEGSVDIGGTSYACTRYRITVTQPELPAQVSEVWVHDKKGVLKGIVEGTAGAERVEMTVTKLDVKRTVSGHEMSCREFTYTTKQGTNRMLMTRDAPTTMVGLTMKMKQAGMEMDNKIELVGLTIKKGS